MVFKGRPSRACQTCKTRRIKCDENKPSCFNCLRSNRCCPGVPQETDLIFRFENPKALRKTRRSGSKTNDHVGADGNGRPGDDCENDQELRARHQHIAESPLRERVQDDGRPHEHGLTIRRPVRDNGLSCMNVQSPVGPPIEQLATIFFFENFVLTAKSQETTRGFLEVAAPMFHACRNGSTLYLATQAVAISIMGNLPDKKALKAKSREFYVRALRGLQHDIAVPSRSKSDETLLSVLLFSMYESVTAMENSARTWARHIDGAVTLAQARGVKQFENPQSLLLFRAVRTQMLTSFIQERHTIPEFPGGWAGDVESDQSAASTLVKLTVELSRLLPKAKSLLALDKTRETSGSVTDLLETACEMQQAMLDWEHQMPAQWGFRSVANLHTPPGPDLMEEMESWPGVLHLYADVHLASIRNNIRVNQIMCVTIVMDAVRWLCPETCEADPRCIAARCRLQSLVDEICYSVPFHLLSTKALQSLGLDDSAKKAGQARGGYFLIWPLLVASNVKEIPEMQRRWLRGRLKVVARSYNLDPDKFLTSVNDGHLGVSWTERLQFPNQCTRDLQLGPWNPSSPDMLTELPAVTDAALSTAGHF